MVTDNKRLRKRVDSDAEPAANSHRCKCPLNSESVNIITIPIKVASGTFV